MVDPDVSQTQDPYGYAAGDPVNTIDPTGTLPQPRYWPVRGGSCLDKYAWRLIHAAVS